MFPALRGVSSLSLSRARTALSKRKRRCQRHPFPHKARRCPDLLRDGAGHLFPSPLALVHRSDDILLQVPPLRRPEYPLSRIEHPDQHSECSAAAIDSRYPSIPTPPTAAPESVEAGAGAVVAKSIGSAAVAVATALAFAVAVASLRGINAGCGGGGGACSPVVCGHLLAFFLSSCGLDAALKLPYWTGDWPSILAAMFLMSLVHVDL
ncbi:uncharacterized protein LY79DRAFT_583624 [Colletotrichum navitas]|uniref:Uncharacterized protein n=1 Tax=Colletotrichum navitas TaxID=681940 RepID=A0AAD8PPV5_9PEZI|nr:uncharacterized protein LY79DRAFT_583624 [Colletotrichum navitas]KAK1573503.1 hypothetical protein LY79DRAFT_583624 [Colletotrichum navitas]